MVPCTTLPHLESLGGGVAAEKGSRPADRLGIPGLVPPLLPSPAHCCVEPVSQGCLQLARQQLLGAGLLPPAGKGLSHQRLVPAGGRGQQLCDCALLVGCALPPGLQQEPKAPGGE